MKYSIKTLLAATSMLALTVAAQAGLITLGGTTGGLERQATLGDAQAGGYGNGNTTASDVGSLFGGSWAIAGDTNDTNGLSNGYLTVSLTSGVWGGQPVITGTWSINSLFFSNYSDAVISMHVGNGLLADNPDFFAWHITGGVTSGTWSYDANIGETGGGLSNLQLWGSGTGRKVPDGGATAALVGISLIGVGFIARRRKTA